MWNFSPMQTETLHLEHGLSEISFNQFVGICRRLLSSVIITMLRRQLMLLNKIKNRMKLWRRTLKMLYNSKWEIDSNELSNVLHMLLIMGLEILDGWTQPLLDN